MRSERAERAPDGGITRSLLGALPDGVAVLDEYGRILAVNDLLCGLLGRMDDELVGSDAADVLAGEGDRCGLRRVLAEVASDHGCSGRVGVELRHGEGGLVDAEVHVAALAGTSRLLASIRKQSRLRRRSGAEGFSWEYLPHRDELHGLPSLEQRAGIGHGRRSLGDALRYVTSAHRERLRNGIESVAAGRFDEVRLDYAVTDPYGRAERFESRMWASRDEDGAVSAVRGTSRPLRERGARPELGYEAGSVDRLQRALENGDFEVFAQPILDLATGRTVQNELLIRLREEDGGVVAPGAFLPAAEASGLILDVDAWMMDRALALAADGRAVQLNLSARSVSSIRMLDRLRDGLRETGADPSLLGIELTETALLADEPAAVAFIGEAGALGCRLALDDFGTGFSSLSLLKRLPVHFLKIDKEFVLDLATNAASRRVVEAVVALARGFGQLTVAEGVEDPELLGLLAHLGVDQVQGYAIARPGPVADVPTLSG